ncbi:NAD-binding protein [Pantanalinema rosaneae CENA516]|uniref:NAD-binding protein n=1 Tax=Pantanalinema rosaneae TaxID=1620701 RepID=UPI003D6EEBBF
MAQSGFSELSDWQEATELEIWLNQIFSCQKIIIKVEDENNDLIVLSESLTVPPQQPILTAVNRSLAKLNNPLIHTVRIYGRQLENPFADWIYEIRRNLTEPTELSNLLNHFLPSPSSTTQGSESWLYSSGDPYSDSSDLVANDASIPQPPLTARVEHFLVCGLGKLGQHCVMALQEFALQNWAQNCEIQVTAIDRQQPDDWEIAQLPERLTGNFTRGDCRQDHILRQAGIEQCRAILIVTSDENVNIETAIAARRLNPHIRLLVRSSKHNLTELLKQKLGNFAAFEPTELSASAFALAALGEEILGQFKLGEQQLRIIKHQVQSADDRFSNLPIHKLHKESSRLLCYVPAPSSDPPTEPSQPKPSSTDAIEQLFYQWSPEGRVQLNDTLIYIEAVESPIGVRQTSAPLSPWQQFWQRLRQIKQGDWRQQFFQWRSWISQDRTRTISIMGLLIALSLGTIGTVLLKLNIPGMSWQSAISSAVILLLGGYGDVFGGLELTISIPWWVQLICFLITAMSILFILSALGVLADRLLSSRFEFLRRRPPVPKSDHVVLVGLGRVGQQIGTYLYAFRQPFVCLTHIPEHQEFMPQVALVYSPMLQGLAKVNLAQAKSLVVATDDQMLNLEIALMARDAAFKLDRTLNLVIRAQEQRFSQHIHGLLPDAKALCIYALSAEAFAGAAFGENILGLFRLSNQTVLVTEYYIEAGDTLNGKLLAQVAYGFGVVPIAYRSQVDGNLRLMPSDDIRLQIGDRLIVLATINGLRRIEWGILAAPRRWQLQALKPLDPGATYYAGNILENIAGCRLSEARAFMDHLPSRLSVPSVMALSLYDHQAFHLIRKLRKLLPVRLMPL